MQVDQLKYNGYDVVVLVHKCNKGENSRHNYRQYTTSGLGDDFLKLTDVVSSWKQHCTRITSIQKKKPTNRKKGGRSCEQEAESRDQVTTPSQGQMSRDLVTTPSHRPEMWSHGLVTRSHDTQGSTVLNGQPMYIPPGTFYTSMNHPAVLQQQFNFQNFFAQFNQNQFNGHI